MLLATRSRSRAPRGFCANLERRNFSALVGREIHNNVQFTNSRDKSVFSLFVRHVNVVVCDLYSAATQQLDQV